MKTYRYNLAAIFVTNNLNFHEHTKHVEVYCHFIEDWTLQGLIFTPCTSTMEHMAETFTKGFTRKSYNLLCGRWLMIDIYTPAQGRLQRNIFIKVFISGILVIGPYSCTSYWAYLDGLTYFFIYMVLLFYLIFLSQTN